MQTNFNQKQSSLRTKEIIEVPRIYDREPKINIPENLKMDFTQILDKPFLISTINWISTQAINTELIRVSLPSNIMSNHLAAVPFNSASFFKSKICAMLQVSGTPMHQGLLLAASIPHNLPQVTHINQLLSAPHVFLNASEATSICLECPMYISSSLARTASAEASNDNLPLYESVAAWDFCDLVLFVVDPLTAAAGSTINLSVSIHAIFKTLDFYVPKAGMGDWIREPDPMRVTRVNAESLEEIYNLPTRIFDKVATGLKDVAGDIIDSGRQLIRSLTGFHNPNIPTIENKHIVSFRNMQNNVDIPMHLEVMDPHAQFSRIYDDYYFRTDQDEMDLKYLLSKPMHVGKFKIKGADTAGTLLFTLPITPMLEATFGTVLGTSYISPMRVIYESSKFWRGDLKLHIQSVCTNFHFTKILVVKDYSTSFGYLNAPGTAGHNHYRKYSTVHNMMNDAIEFSGGGQIQTIVLPYCSNYRQLPCTKDIPMNGMTHGVVSAYLVQPLTYNSNVPTEITFNVYISGGDNLQFSGYATDPVKILDTSPAIFKSIPGVVNTAELIDYGKKGNTTYRKKKPQFTQNEVEKEIIRNRFTMKSGLYTIQEGDTINGFNKKFGLSESEFVKLNPQYGDRSSGTYSCTPLLRTGDTLRWRNKDDPEPKVVVREGKEQLMKTPNLSIKTTLNPFRYCVDTTVNNLFKVFHGLSGGLRVKLNMMNSYLGDIACTMNMCDKERTIIEKIPRKFVKESNEVLVKPNEQTDLLIQKTQGEELGIAFRPNVSVRDYLRRFQPIYNKSINTNANLEVDVTTGIPIQEMLHLSQGSSFNNLLYLYYGMSGGLKFKIRITGATNAEVKFKPPAIHALTENMMQFSCSNKLEIDSSFTAHVTAMKGLMGFDVASPAMKAPLPTIEISDYVRPYAIGEKPNTLVRPSNILEYEMAIPNMNHRNFVGSSLKYGIYDSNDPLSDLGSIVITNIIPTKVGDIPTAINITVYAALNDEARLGFQVYNVTREIPTVASLGSQIVKNSVDILNEGFQIPTATSGLLVAQPYKNLYYFKTT